MRVNNLIEKKNRREAERAEKKKEMQASRMSKANKSVSFHGNKSSKGGKNKTQTKFKKNIN